MSSHHFVCDATGTRTCVRVDGDECGSAGDHQQHRLLDIAPKTAMFSFRFGEFLNTDAIAIDEAAMTDLSSTRIRKSSMSIKMRFMRRWSSAIIQSCVASASDLVSEHRARHRGRKGVRPSDPSGWLRWPARYRVHSLGAHLTLVI